MGRWTMFRRRRFLSRPYKWESFKNFNSRSNFLKTFLGSQMQSYCRRWLALSDPLRGRRRLRFWVERIWSAGPEPYLDAGRSGGAQPAGDLRGWRLQLGERRLPPLDGPLREWPPLWLGLEQVGPAGARPEHGRPRRHAHGHSRRREGGHGVLQVLGQSHWDGAGEWREMSVKQWGE